MQRETTSDSWHEKDKLQLALTEAAMKQHSLLEHHHLHP